MWQAIGYLVGGNAFIALSFSCLWVIGATMSRHLVTQWFGRPTRADLRAIGLMMALWTVACSIVAIAEAVE